MAEVGAFSTSSLANVLPSLRLPFLCASPSKLPPVPFCRFRIITINISNIFLLQMATFKALQVTALKESVDEALSALSVQTLSRKPLRNNEVHLRFHFQL